jgi:hypothetical protein
MDTMERIKIRKLRDLSFVRNVNGFDSLSESLLFSAPSEIYIHYLDYMDLYDIPKASLVCQFFRNYFRSDHFIETLSEIYHIIPRNVTPPLCFKYFAFSDNIEKFNWAHTIFGEYSGSFKAPLMKAFLKDLLKNVTLFKGIKVIRAIRRSGLSHLLIVCAILFAHLYPNCHVAMYNKQWYKGGKVDESLETIDGLAREILPCGSRVFASNNGKEKWYGNIRLTASFDGLEDVDFVFIDNFHKEIGEKHYGDIVKLDSKVIAGQTLWMDDSLEGLELEDWRTYKSEIIKEGSSKKKEYMLPFRLLLYKRKLSEE